MGRSGEGRGEEKKKGVKRSRRPSRPPWLIPEEAERPKERVVQQRKEERKEERKKVQEEKDRKGVVTAESNREEGKAGEEGVERAKVKAAVASSVEKVQTPGGSRKPDGSFNVMEHLDLLSDSSSGDMDLASDGEKPSTEAGKTPTSADASRLKALPPEGAPQTDLVKPSQPDSGVTMNEGGPGTQLHWELVEYDRRSQLTPIEARRRTEVVSIVTDAALRVCPGALVMPFGGYANGLCTPGSDLDLVIVGVASPNAEHGGYKDPEKGMVSNLLGEVLNRLRHGPLDLRKQIVIRRARIPIIKATTNDGIEVDISICDDHGPRAADFMREQVQAYAPLRPLVLSLKALLKDRHLNEVVTGGMGTYALSNMVLAHLMEGRKHAEQLDDFGCLLVSFLKRFGKDFDFYRDAISIRRGGICRKSDVIDAGVVERKNYEVNYNRRQNDGDPPWERLVVEDYFTGRDVSSGTYRIGEIQKLFAAVHKRLLNQFLIPPLPPDSPYLSTLSTLFEVKGFTKSRRSYDDGEMRTPETSAQPSYVASKRQRFSETREPSKSLKSDMGVGSASTAPSKSTLHLNGNNNTGNQKPQKEIHTLNRADFVERVKMILRAPR